MYRVLASHTKIVSAVSAAGLAAIASVWLSTGPSSASTGDDSHVVTILPAVSDLSAGGKVATYGMPDGEDMVVPTPPAGFDPLAATDAELAEYDFPARPASTSADYADWLTAMQAFQGDPASSSAVTVDTSPDPTIQNSATVYANWAGYAGGVRGQQNRRFVGVKSVYVVPSISGTACNASTRDLSEWVGLGGTTGTSDLSQEGIECGEGLGGGGGAFYGFTEFANTASPVVFCGYSSWSFPAGHTVYVNMSYETSSNIANFYLEDETTGVAHGCSRGAPSGWHFDGNTAEWIIESPSAAYGYTEPNFGTARMTDDLAEDGSTGDWVTLGSRSNIVTFIEGSSSTDRCAIPGAINANNKRFPIVWNKATCY